MFRRRSHDDFSREIQAHLELETDRLIAEGRSPEDARDAARRSFGNVVAAKERFYESSRWVWLEQLVQDLRYAVRSLRRSPSFLATTVLTLAVGLGLITVAFTVVNAYVLRPFAIRDPGGLHKVSWLSQDSGGPIFRWRDYEELRGQTAIFDSVVAESTRFVSSNGRPLAAALVSENYFAALAPRIAAGRALGGIDAGQAGEPVVLSDQAWARLYGRDPAAVGRLIDLNGRPFTIVGVVGPEFVGLGDSPRDLWVPFTTYAAVANPAMVGVNQPRVVEIFARLRSGVSAPQAQDAITPLVRRFVEPKPEIAPSVRAEVRPYSSPNPMSLQLMAILAPIFAAFGLVLITACANVSNVMLARAISRHREIAVRLSVGASRGRVVRQLLTEGLLIAVLAGAAGLALAAWALRVATAAFYGTLPPSAAAIVRLAPIGLDHRVFIFTLAIATVATLLFALIPALQASRVTLTDALRGQGGSAGRGSKLRSALVIGQVAVSLVLVIVALTLARNGSAVGALDLGYETDGVVSINVRGDDKRIVPRLADALASDPRISEVAVTGGNPLFIRERSVAAGPAEGQGVATRFTFVSPDYFPLLRLPIVRGRAFRDDEARTSAHVAIVSEATASAFWPGQDAIGRTIRIERPDGRPVEEIPGYSLVTVVGTTPDVVSGMMTDGKDGGHIYLPAAADASQVTAVLVRGRAPGDAGPENLQRLFQQVGTDPQVFEALPLDEMRALQVYPLLAASWVGTVLGAVALALSVSGLYGVLTYTLSQRTREIGIRMALGATASAVVRLVMGQSARLAGIGAGIGLAVAYAALALLNSAIQLETVSLLDLVSFGGGLVLVASAAALAAYQPARRATRVNPSLTLRTD